MSEQVRGFVGRTVTVLVLVTMTGMGGLDARPAIAESGVTLRYTCVAPALPAQPMTARIVWNGPPSVPDGQPTPPVRVDTAGTVGPGVTAGLNFVGAASVDGTVDAAGTVIAPDGNIPADLHLTAGRTPVPPSGPMTLPASGTTPSLVFHRPGHATVNVGTKLALRLTAYDAHGNPIGPGAVDLACTAGFRAEHDGVRVRHHRPSAAAHPTSRPARVAPSAGRRRCRRQCARRDRSRPAGGAAAGGAECHHPAAINPHAGDDHHGRPDQ